MSDPTASAVEAAAATPPASAPSNSAMSRAVADLMASKGMQSLPPNGSDPAMTDMPALPAEPAVVDAPAAEPAPVEPTEPVITAPKDPKELYDRLAKKDGLYQSERNRARQFEQQLADMRKEHEAFVTRLSQDPLAVLRERNIRFGDLAMQSLTGKGEPKVDPKQAPSAIPAELQAKLDEQDKFIAELKREREQSQQQTQRESAIGLVRDHLKDQDFPLVNELGKHADVLELVQRHVGNHGAFADDREAAEVVEFYARQVEQQQRRDFLAQAQRPGIKALLAKELGFSPAQRDAPPARPENQGNMRTPNPRPALSNDFTTQRTSMAEPKGFDLEEAKRQTVAEMQATYNAHRAG